MGCGTTRRIRDVAYKCAYSLYICITVKHSFTFCVFLCISLRVSVAVCLDNGIEITLAAKNCNANGLSNLPNVKEDTLKKMVYK